jgi:hypothetical protein
MYLEWRSRLKWRMRVLHLSDGTTLTPKQGEMGKQEIVAITLTNSHAPYSREQALDNSLLPLAFQHRT